MLGDIRIFVVRAECEPRPLNHALLFETLGYREVPHGLLHVVSEWARTIKVSVGEGIANATMAPSEYLPVTSVSLFPPWSAKVTGVGVIQEEPCRVADVLSAICRADTSITMCELVFAQLDLYQDYGAAAVL